MTTNQIAFYDAETRRLGLGETTRHNTVSEVETSRHNIVTEVEASRHNLADESLRHETNIINKEHYERADAINLYSAQSTDAHYRRMDATDYLSAVWNNEHNIRADAINANRAQTYAYEVSEQARHNRMSEALNFSDQALRRDLGYAGIAYDYADLYEKARHNTETEEQGRFQNITDYVGKSGSLSINRENAETNAKNADINQQNAETNRANAETNARNADISQQNADINQQNADTRKTEAAWKIVHDSWNDALKGVQTVNDILSKWRYQY